MSRAHESMPPFIFMSTGRIFVSIFSAALLLLILGLAHCVGDGLLRQVRGN